MRALTTLAPQDLPRGVAFSLNPAVLTFAVAVSLLTGIVFGLVPAVVASRADVAGLLEGSTPRVWKRRPRPHDQKRAGGR